MAFPSVPLGKVQDIQSFPYGPKNIFITWDELSRKELQGDVNNQLFFVSLDSVMSGQTNESQIDITEGLEPSTNYPFNVSLRMNSNLSHTPRPVASGAVVVTSPSCSSQ